MEISATLQKIIEEQGKRIWHSSLDICEDKNEKTNSISNTGNIVFINNI